jgi:pyruvate,water dikinase
MGLRFIKNFNEIGMNDIGLVGGKNASTGEMIKNLSHEGIKIPNGFVITADAFSEIIKSNHLTDIYDLMERKDIADIKALEETGSNIRSRIKEAGLPKSVSSEIITAYKILCEGKKNPIAVSVRSSATAEDLPEASFAGQQETFLNIQGETALLEACLNCFASLFTNRAISYRNSNHFDHRKVRLSIGIQAMIRSDLASSGVIFTIDTESGADNVILITSSYGLGENIVAGKVNPDEFLVSKPLLDFSKSPILRRRLGLKQFELIYDPNETGKTTNVEVQRERRDKYSLQESEVIELAHFAKKIETYYSKRKGAATPMDIEWAKDGETGELFILQARPETIHSNIGAEEKIMTLLEKSKILLTGKAVGSKIGSGKVRVIKDRNELSTFLLGDVLVADMTDPDWEPVMKLASAIITNRGGRTCHAAIVSREHGVPCIVGTNTATFDLNDGEIVTVSCSEGETGNVYQGRLKTSTRSFNRAQVKMPQTKVMVNLANPDQALKVSRLPVDGIGLARMEFIITHEIKAHPMAFVHPELLDDITRKEVQKLSKNFNNNGEMFFVRTLAEEVAMIAGAFYPRPVILRFSDFKTNEYAHLLGGKVFEPFEKNPMIGFRGASRYYNPRYREGFALECKAIQYVRNQIGLRNLKVMVPFCRTPAEAQLVLEEMKKNGLERGKDNLEVYMMCEIPSNVLEMEAFAKYFDGFSIGSNDLTQMTLGVDRDSELVSGLFDEREPAAMMMIGLAVTNAKKAQRPIGICGQAPSDYPEVCRFLIRKGIDSISLTPDAVLKGIEVIVNAENVGPSEEMYPH